MTQFTKRLLGATALAASFMGPSLASAADLEIIHWWTSKGEAKAVAEFAKAFDAGGDKWIDSAIALGQTARATIMQRALGGDPPGGAQFNPGPEEEELIKNDLLLTLDDVAAEGKWAEVIRPRPFIDARCQNRHR